MYTMRGSDRDPNAIFMCWYVISSGAWSDSQIERLMRHALGYILAGFNGDLPCDSNAIMSPTTCYAPRNFTDADVRFICDGGNVYGGVCESVMHAID